MQFCKVADITDWQDPDFGAAAAQLDLEHQAARKFWEYIQVYRGLTQLGLLNGASKALGLGVGHERLIYALTNVCEEVIATDLYQTSGWQTADMAVNEVYELSPLPYQRDRLVVRHMDMTQIDYPDAQFDFVWSCCSIEHVNNFRDFHQVFREIHRVLKPGGIAALTTEYNPTDRPSYEPNMLFTDRHWIEHWFTRPDPLVQGLELLDTPDFTLMPAPENEPKLRRQQSKIAIPVYSRDIVLNSISFFLRKAGEFSRDYDENWLPPSLQRYLAACEHQRTQQVPLAEQMFKALLESDEADARLKAAAARRLIVSLHSRGNVSEAIDYCYRALPFCLQTDNADHLLPLAHRCKKLKLWDAAKLLYEKVEASPGSHAAQVIRSLIGQAEYFAQQQQFQTALARVNQAYEEFAPSEMGDELAKVHFLRGLYYEHLDHYPQAIAAYQLALEHTAADSKMATNCTTRLQACRTTKQINPWVQRLKAWTSKFASFSDSPPHHQPRSSQSR